MWRPVSNNALLRPIHLLAILGIVAVLLGCGTINTITTANLDPSGLSLQFSVTDLDPASPTVAVFAMLRLKGTQMDEVHFRHGETLTCNQIQLQEDGPGYSANIPRAALPGDYSLTYTRQGSHATVTLPASARPILSQPADGSAVSLSSISGSPKFLTVVIQRSSAATSLQVRAADGVGHIYTASGTDVTSIDVDDFVPSMGTVSLTETYRDDSQDTDFAEAALQYDSVTTDAVQWTA